MRFLAAVSFVIALTAMANPALANRLTNPGFEVSSTLLESFPAQPTSSCGSMSS